MRRRQFLRTAGIGLVAYALQPNAQAKEVVQAERPKFLLLDSRLIASTDNAKLSRAKAYSFSCGAP